MSLSKTKQNQKQKSTKTQKANFPWFVLTELIGHFLNSIKAFFPTIAAHWTPFFCCYLFLLSKSKIFFISVMMKASWFQKDNQQWLYNCLVVLCWTEIELMKTRTSGLTWKKDERYFNNFVIYPHLNLFVLGCRIWWLLSLGDTR